jgi:hypothetical protein
MNANESVNGVLMAFTYSYIINKIQCVCKSIANGVFLLAISI